MNTEDVRNDPRDEDLGDRVKAFESLEARRMLADALPIVIRLDGRAFHTFTRGCERPFDANLRSLMVDTARICALETNAVLTYTQSDEITLVLNGNVPGGTQAYFGGRVQKMVSCLAARASVAFNALLPKYLPSKVGASPVFDCRAWSVPSRAEACDAVQWRETDARVNAVEMAARAHFSHKALDGKSGPEMRGMMLDKGVDFRDYPVEFRRGTYLQRKEIRRKYTTTELEVLPPKHNARTNPDLEVVRHDLLEINMPPFFLITNREEVVFDGADPITKDR